MKWLAKINLRVVVERLGSFKSALFLFTVIGLCLFSGYRLGNYYHHFQVTNLEQQKLRLDQLYHQQEQSIARIHSLEVELTVEQLANNKAQNLLKEAAERQFEVKKQLAFYEKIMAPEKDAEGLLVEDVKITASNSPNTYHFQVVLVQQRLKRRYSKGYIELILDGQQEDKPLKIKLDQISNLNKKDLKFSFQYFQIISGEFSLPKSFTPEKVLVSAILTKSRWQKYAKKERTFPWLVSQQP
ncbi:DUF6776 family protein [Colwellia psychrerythraea]|uniref:Uncharacterized protein n=1 Tax=Colwellia psychrerythraea TaxID=28229 RepID=A0A099KPW5_COLPS|nr:DUF6776 family protein [Colwellia psychrerythraea]KGJ91648.1 hypothetical protein GAB14E_3130 [Colwellia psychrerythraea]